MFISIIHWNDGKANERTSVREIKLNGFQV